MTRLLLRSGKSPFTVLTPGAALDHTPSGVFAINVGNTVFSDAMHRILSTAENEVVSNAYLSERVGVDRRYLDRVNDEFDHFVIPLANAFRPEFVPVLDRLSATVEGLRIPVTVAGVGVAGGPGSLEGRPEDAGDEVKRATRRFMNAVLDRSSRVGVRGENTRRYLRSLGYGDDKVEIIGCPSLFRYGKALRIDKSPRPLDAQDALAINLTPYVAAMADCARRHAARYPNMVYIPQDIATLRLLLTGENPERFDVAMPTHSGHALYRLGRMKFFVDSLPWIDFLKTVRFSFGTRIHGNIASLVAAVPAVVLVHDTRTQELVDYHEIPFRLAAEGAELDAAQLYDEADFGAFNLGHGARFDTFHRFLREHRLRSVFDPGQANPDYDRRLAALPLPGPVVPNRHARKPGLAGRVQRRWQYMTYRFTAPVPHTPHSVMQAVAARVAQALERQAP